MSLFASETNKTLKEEVMLVQKLKNGSYLEIVLVTQIMERLRLLGKNHPIPFDQFVKCCRNRSSVILSATIIPIRRMDLVKEGDLISDDVRNVVLSAVEGDGLQLKLGTPFA